MYKYRKIPAAKQLGTQCVGCASVHFKVSLVEKQKTFTNFLVLKVAKQSTDHRWPPTAAPKAGLFQVVRF